MTIVNETALPGMASLLDRGDFPILERITYLNAAGIGLVPLPVQDRMMVFARQLGIEGTTFFFDRFDEIILAPRRSVARLFNAPLESVAIVNSASEAISQVAAWRRPLAHENVVVIDIDHPTTSFPWLRMAEDTGAEVRFVQVAKDPVSLSVEKIAALVDSNTAAISISHVQWTTGQLLDLTRLSELAHVHDALLVIDATHSAGVVPIDAPASGADILVTGSFKWLCGYSGAGACYIRPDLAERFRPVMVGSRTLQTEVKPGGTVISALSLPQGAARLEYGSSAQILRVAYASAIDYLMAAGIGHIHSHVQALGTTLADGLLRLGAELQTPLDPAQRAGIITARFPGRDADELAAALEKQGVVAIVRMGAIRFSPHGYNHQGDIARALNVLGELLV